MNFLDAFAGYDKPYRLLLVHPGTGEPILDKDKEQAYIDIYSAQSEAALAHRKKLFGKRKQFAKNDITFEKAQSTGAEWYVALTAGWYLFNPNTSETVIFSKEAAQEIYSDPKGGWIIKQIDQALEDDSNFLT